MKHGKVTTITAQEDGIIKHETRSYHEHLASVKEQLEQHIQTNRDTFLSDIIACLRVITEQKTQHLIIEIKSDENFQPKLITKMYTTKIETFKRR